MLAERKKFVWTVLVIGALIVGCKKTEEPAAPAPAAATPTAPAADPGSSSGLTFDEIMADAKAVQLSLKLKDQIKGRDWTTAQATFDELNALRPRLSSAKQSSIDALQKLLDNAKAGLPAPAQ